MFVWGKNDLNPEQEKAIYNENSILLIACPGSGKTRTITYKIAYELSKLESNKQYIIAITYTNRAADEIKERIELFGKIGVCCYSGLAERNAEYHVNSIFYRS